MHLFGCLFVLVGLVAVAASDLCESDVDCHLNGACEIGVCHCDRGWRGPRCEFLDLLNGSVAYGYGTSKTPNTSCWGGGPPFLGDDGQYHLLVTEIAGHCGFATWGRMSQATHAVAQNISGPYAPVNVAVPTEAHNVYYAYSSDDKTHLVFHIGLGDNPPSCNPYFNCTNGTTRNGCGGGFDGPSNWTKPTCHPDMESTVSFATDLSGPWKTQKLDLPCPPNIGATNPAPLRLSNGTWLLMTRGANLRRLPNGTLEHYQNMLLFRAESWKGPWELVRGTGEDGALNINAPGSKVQTEDPTFWKGRRGYHALFHYNLLHAYSEDAINWHWSPDVTANLTLKNGVARDDHQRPRAIVNKDGDLEALMVASISPSVIPGRRCTDATQLLYFETRDPESGFPPVPAGWTPSFEVLGVYAYHRNGSGENTPFRFKGDQYMMESASTTLSDGTGTTCFQIKKFDSGELIAVVNQSAHHAFFSAVVDYEKDIVWVFGSSHDRDTRRGTCDLSRYNCSIGVWSSTDLVEWKTGPPLLLGSFGPWFPINVDVDFVRPHSGIPPAPGLPPHQAVMYMETGPPYNPPRDTTPHQFALNIGTDGDLSKNWILAPANRSTATAYPATYGAINSCPSVRYDPEEGYYYVFGGGAIISGPARSKDLFHWEVSEKAPVTGPAHWLGRPLVNMVAPGIYTTQWAGGDKAPGAPYLPFLKNMTVWNYGTSDADMSTNDGSSPTYINWISSTQGTPKGVVAKGTNFGSIGRYNGTVVEFLRHYFDTSVDDGVDYAPLPKRGQLDYSKAATVN